jgi:hypothetical protein
MDFLSMMMLMRDHLVMAENPGDASSMNPRQGGYCFHDLLVTRTPAQIPGDSFSDLFLGGIGVLVKEGLCNENHPRGAKSTLNPSILDKSLLDGMKFPIFL